MAKGFFKQVKEKTGYKIVALQQLGDYIHSDEGFANETPYVGPREFLNYIRNAEYVFTDSFHCSVFSILYKKNFFTFNRFAEGAKQSTNTRIDNLLHITGLEDRRMTTDKTVDGVINYNGSFDGVDARLNAYRKSSMEYLHNALKDL